MSQAWKFLVLEFMVVLGYKRCSFWRMHELIQLRWWLHWFCWSWLFCLHLWNQRRIYWFSHASWKWHRNSLEVLKWCNFLKVEKYNCSYKAHDQELYSWIIHMKSRQQVSLKIFTFPSFSFRTFLFNISWICSREIFSNRWH